MTINERIRYLRKDILDLTQQKFSSELKISRSNMGNIETGAVAVTDRIISDICSCFNISEHWLRTGEGEPRLKESSADAYRRAADAVASGSHEMDRIVRGIITYYGNMDDDCKNLFWDYLQKVSSLVSGSESKHSAAPDENGLEKQYDPKDVNDKSI